MFDSVKQLSVEHAEHGIKQDKQERPLPLGEGRGEGNKDEE